ncbi:MAG TPA: hypothetical protein VEF72_32760 [Mycobacterium sp.]|nr:hypothetical protein [Mycobacterium sp.]
MANVNPTAPALPKPRSALPAPANLREVRKAQAQARRETEDAKRRHPAGTAAKKAPAKKAEKPAPAKGEKAEGRKAPRVSGQAKLRWHPVGEATDARTGQIVATVGDFGITRRIRIRRIRPVMGRGEQLGAVVVMVGTVGRTGFLRTGSGRSFRSVRFPRGREL